MQCTGSNVGSALIDGVSKHNARNPDNRILYLNCGALATELTNEQCDFWQFRFTGNVEMRSRRPRQGAADRCQESLPAEPGLPVRPIRAARHAANGWPSCDRISRLSATNSCRSARCRTSRPTSPKIKASGAQSVITGNYNRDLNLLIKAAVDDGLNVRFDTYLAHLIGGPTAIGAAGQDRLSTITEFDPNVPVELKKPDAEAFTTGWRTNHDTDFSEVPFLTMFQMLAKAIDQAGSTDALKVAPCPGRHEGDRPGWLPSRDAQGRPPASDAVLRRHLLARREVRFREDRFWLEDRLYRDSRGSYAAHNLQNEAPDLLAADRFRQWKPY